MGQDIAVSNIVVVGDGRGGRDGNRRTSVVGVLFGKSDIRVFEQAQCDDIVVGYVLPDGVADNTKAESAARATGEMQFSEGETAVSIYGRESKPSVVESAGYE